MKTIGILGGLGPESTMAYYSYITRKYYEGHLDYAYPQIIIYSFKFSEFIEAGYKMPVAVKAAIESLHRAGADFVVAACNSVHIVYNQVSKDIPIPWVSIVEATAQKINNQRLDKVGLLGTIFTMGNDFYQKGLAEYGIETVTPNKHSQQKINQIIYGELVRAEIKEESRQTVLGIINELTQKGAKGIILACTELPFLIRQEDTNIPVFDTTTIHAQKALDLALEEGP